MSSIVKGDKIPPRKKLTARGKTGGKTVLGPNDAPMTVGQRNKMVKRLKVAEENRAPKSKQPVKKLKNPKSTPKPLKKVISKLMDNKLKKHRQVHKDNNNDPKMLSKHMKVMRDLIRQGKSFNVSHARAQEKYGMK